MPVRDGDLARRRDDDVSLRTHQLVREQARSQHHRWLCATTTTITHSTLSTARSLAYMEKKVQFRYPKVKKKHNQPAGAEDFCVLDDTGRGWFLTALAFPGPAADPLSTNGPNPGKAALRLYCAPNCTGTPLAGGTVTPAPLLAIAAQVLPQKLYGRCLVFT